MSDNKKLNDLRTSLERTIRVSDQSCTGYAILRDRYQQWSLLLDLAILLLSLWLIAMVWVQPNIADKLTPSGIAREIWLGLLAILTFALSLLQILVNWKEKANSYHQAMLILSTYVKELRPLWNSEDNALIESALIRYQAITEPLAPIPDSQFLKLKKRHKMKVLTSKFLDRHPGTSLTLLRIVVWWRSNIAVLSWKDDQKL